MQGSIVVPLCVGNPVHVHGVASRGAIAETPKNTLPELVLTYIKVWKAGERLLLAQTEICDT